MAPHLAPNPTPCRHLMLCTTPPLHLPHGHQPCLQREASPPPSSHLVSTYHLVPAPLRPLTQCWSAPGRSWTPGPPAPPVRVPAQALSQVLFKAPHSSSLSSPLSTPHSSSHSSSSLKILTQALTQALSQALTQAPHSSFLSSPLSSPLSRPLSQLSLKISPYACPAYA